MEEMSYKDRIKKFLEDERYYSLLIKGKWGVGKTYLWKEIQDMNNSNTQSFGKKIKKYFCRDKNIIYISLFGKESYKEVLEEIVIKACTTMEFLSKLLGGLKVAGDISIGTILTLIKSKYFKQTVDFTNIIVCFDDIERKSHNFRMKDFLGLVYQLKEDKCKVVIISNIDELPNYEEKIFKKYKEKSIDLTIEIESKKEVIAQILKEKLKDGYYKELFPDNVYRIENLRNLNKIIEAFKFFSQEFNFKDRFKENNEFKNLFTYVFELIVTKINDNDSKKSESSIYYKDKKEKYILEQSQGIINIMIGNYIKNATFHISPSMIKQFKQEYIKNYHFYTLMRELKEKFYSKDYSNELKNKIEKILNELKAKGYANIFVDELFRNDGFCIFDFLAMVEALELDNDIIITIKKEIIGRIAYADNERLLKLVCGDNKELKKHAEERLAKINANKKSKSPQTYRKQTYEERLLMANNYHEFKNIIISSNEVLKNKNLNFIDDKIILQFIYYLSSDEEFKNEYPELHEKLCLFLKNHKMLNE